jgi:hypothetical protein
MIYALVFQELSLCYVGSGWLVYEKDEQKVVSQCHGPALLRTCRRVNDDIGHEWLSHIDLIFYYSSRMLSVLAPLPVEKLSKLRYLTVDARLLLLSKGYHGRGEPPCYNLAAVLRLVPGLRLNKLHVRGTGLFKRDYEMVDELVKHGNGWKELWFEPYYAKLWYYVKSTFKPQGQPAKWDTVLKERDGASSQASATIWQPSGRLLERGKGYLDDDEVNTNVSYEDLHGPTFFVFKRGRGVDYEEKEDAPLLDKDIRRDHLGRT